MKTFFEFSNKQENVTALYVYGEIVSGTDKWDESDVTFKDFQQATENIKDNSTLEMYVSSPGGSVFTTQSMVSMLDRCKKKKNIKIIAYVDGLAASCASWLIMIADEIVIYSNSMLMVHKPMTMTCGNANELQKEIDLLNKLENDIMLPMYMKKAKNITEEELKELINAETWLAADEIQEKFNVTYVDEEKKVAAKLEKDSINKYKNVPKSVKELFNSFKETEDKKEDEKPIMSEATKSLIDRINSKSKLWEAY